MSREKNAKINAAEYRDAAIKLKTPPRVVYIETTNACNLRCPMCPITMGVKSFTWETKYFPWETFERIRPLLATAERVIMSGGGEPFLHPRFIEMVAATKKAGAFVVFNSNGVLMTEDKAKELVRVEADTISFSVDGATTETYSAIRVGGDFERLRENIARLVAIKKSAGSEKPYLNIQTTLSKANRHEIVAMVELAAQWGIRHIVIEPLTPVFNEDKTYADYYRQNVVPAAECADDIRAAKKRAAELGLIFTSHYLVLIGDEPAASDPRKFRCVEPWINMGFRSDGTIFPCCGTSHTMGNIKDGDPVDLWNNEEYRSLRKAFANSTPPDYCELCIGEGRAMRFNSDLVLG